MKLLNLFRWFDKNTLLHLRFPFSFFLMPVFMFALSRAVSVNWANTSVAFIILHVLMFPSSNGYNSYQDRDETSIGGLKNPPPVSKNLFYVTLLMDIVAVMAGLFISVTFSLMAGLFIFVSRAYSYRPVRLKRYPVIAFLIVSLFQGAFVYLMSAVAIQGEVILNYATAEIYICMGISSLFIGSMYPLTQIYQHEADKNDGVISISYKLGYIGTFLFSSLLFLLATFLVYTYFLNINQIKYFSLFLLMMFPVVSWMLIWLVKVIRNRKQANYNNTMYMNLVTSVCMNLFFIFLTLNRYGNWY